MRRTRTVALLTLAMLEAFTLAAGTAVTRMLPPRLALLQPARVAPAPVAHAGPVLRDPGRAGRTGPMPTASGLAAALTGPMSSRAFGSDAAVVVADAATGRVLYSRNGGSLLAPASTGKLATAVAALHVLGPGYRFTTRVVSGASPGSIVLVGGGDPTLAAGTPPASDYPQPATLKDLAAKTARALRARHRTRVGLGYDTSLYGGPGLAPGWPGSYVTSGNVTPVTPLEADQGRLTAGGTPQDAYDPVNYRPRSAHPAAAAAAAFAGFLSGDGIRVSGTPAKVTAPRGAATLASVSSPPLSAIVQLMLLNSDNVIAENLARHVALAAGRPPTFAGAAAAVRAVVQRLGVPGAGTGIQMVDGSGLSPQDRIAPGVLVRLLILAASPDHPGLRPVITGLPVAGFAGTLAKGHSVFGSIGGAALGVVRAKTGNLSTVAALAGLAYDSDGRLLAFDVNAGRIPKAADLGAAATALDSAASALAACGCR
jgi:D-alanyl-D-alanine carboxypeptidase/D-alanyl-D-alanine-endopeptidase (penicillin-binding protein 4)